MRRIRGNLCSIGRFSYRSFLCIPYGQVRSFATSYPRRDDNDCIVGHLGVENVENDVYCLL